jgi:hypothetical protein
MSEIILVDTSVLLNVLNVPGRNESRVEVMGELRIHIEQQNHLLLPMAAVVETGNHIAHIGNGAQARAAADRFVAEVGRALRGESPWRMTQFPNNEQVLSWLSDFPDSVGRGVGFGDLSIIKEWESTCAKHPMSTVVIWSKDGDLAGYEQRH